VTDFETRFRGYDVLEKWNTVDWDDQTRRVVRERIEQVPPYRFFTPAEAATLEAVVERILPQPDRTGDMRVPIGPWIDAKLFDDARDGYRYAELPPQRETWRAALAGLDELARSRHAVAFVALTPGQQDELLHAVQRGEPGGGAWSRVPAARFFKNVLCSVIAKIYYAHPTAWSECGYNGPSSPRGHVRKWIGGVDPWEARDRPTRG
jgi:hypothetical protein